MESLKAFIHGEAAGEACWQTLQVGQTGPCAFCSNDKLLTADGEPAGVYEWEFQNTRNDRWYEIRDRAIRWGDGRLVRLEIAMDITERKRAEKALRETKEFYERLVGEAGDAIITLDRQGIVLTWNTGAERIFGWTAGEAIGSSYVELNAPDATHGIEENIRRVFSGETINNIDVRRRRKDGTRFDALITVSPVRDAKGNITAIQGIAKDITELKRAEEKIRSLKEFNENIIRSIQGGLVVLDRKMRLILWNKRMEEISGYTEEEVLFKVAYEVFPHLEEEGVIELQKAALKGQVVERANIPYLTPKGKSGYTNEKYFPLRDDEGNIIGIMGTIEDVTTILTLEQHVASLQEEIRERRLIDIAKGILMRERGITIFESHNFILEKSRYGRVKAGEIARQLIVLMGTPEERKKYAKRILE